MNPALIKDCYKIDHRSQYPNGLEEVYSNFTARGSRIPSIDRVVVFAIQYFLREYLINRWDRDFFDAPKDKVLRSYKKRADSMLGKDVVNTDHIAALHGLGYLPLLIKALPEGSLCPIRVPMLTIKNTLPEYAWLTNMIETNLSLAIWHPQTSATKSFYLYKQLYEDAKRTNPEMVDFVKYQAHDFSMRGQTSLESAMASGAGHLLSFRGSDTIPAIDWLEKYYDANEEIDEIASSVSATEHSVMQSYGRENERETIRHLIQDVYPTGIVSIVSDTWDYWNTITNIAASLKEIIMSRPGTTTFRPDSGRPVDIICGDPNAEIGSPEYKGSIECLWDIFGGTETSTGYKQLDSHVSLIYGDSMNEDTMREINARLQQKRFASTNYLGGVGSFFFQYVTRDTFGSAVKNTSVTINGERQATYKDPKTDSGLKKSARGYLRINADLSLNEDVTPEEENEGMLQVVFKDSDLFNQQTFAQIRERLMSQLDYR